MTLSEANRTDRSIADVEQLERLLLGFVCELAVIDARLARRLSLLIDRRAFADQLCGLIAATSIGIAARQGKVDLVDIVGELTLRHGINPTTAIEELGAALTAFDDTFGAA